jgi:hypothetical protein
MSYKKWQYLLDYYLLTEKRVISFSLRWTYSQVSIAIVESRWPLHISYDLIR